MSSSNKRICRTFKLQGLNIRTDALTLLSQELESSPELNIQDVIHAIKHNGDSSNSSTTVVTLHRIESALESLLQVTASENAFTPFQVFSTLNSNRISYDRRIKKYSVIQNSKSLLASTEDRLQLFSRRFDLVSARVLRHPIFKNNNHVISRIESLIGSNNTSNSSYEENKRLLGMLRRDETSGKLFIEDNTGSIAITFAEDVKFNDGYYCINYIVLVEGYVSSDEDVFIATLVANPPPENRVDSINAMGDSIPPFYYGMEPLSTEQYNDIGLLESQDQDAALIVLSDVHLDNPAVIQNLNVLLQGFSECCDPSSSDSNSKMVVVLIGSFISTAVGTTSTASCLSITDIRECFEALGAIIQKYEQNFHFVIVPGPHDPNFADVLPRMPLPQVVAADISSLDNVTMASNPCRIRFYTQEIVISRNDLCLKVRKHAVASSSSVSSENEDGDTSTQLLVKTVIDQGHLCPLPLTVQPIYWNHDLNLFPVPDVLVLADKVDSYSIRYNDVSVLNPGPFYVDFSFLLYRPMTKTAEVTSVVA